MAKIQLKDIELWKQKNKYNKRWIVEYTFSVFKRTFGHSVYSKKKKYVVNELISKINLYNKLLKINKKKINHLDKRKHKKNCIFFEHCATQLFII